MKKLLVVVLFALAREALNSWPRTGRLCMLLIVATAIIYAPWIIQR